MKFGKVITATVLGASLLLGTTGCSLSSNIASLAPYSPSDGAQINLDHVKFRNFLYLVSPEHRVLIGSLVNSGLDDQTVVIEYEDADTGDLVSKEFLVPAGQKVDFGFNENAPIEATMQNKRGEPAAPGGLTTAYVSLLSGTAQELDIPILDGTLPEYADVLNDLAHEEG